MVEFNAFLLENYANGQNTYMCGDYNLDLLKIHIAYRLMRITLIISYPLVITLPTRLSDNCTLIDNIFTSNLSSDIFSCILNNHISDHQPIVLYSNDDLPPTKHKYITIKSNTDEAKALFCTSFKNKYIRDQLDTNIHNTDPNHNYEILERSLIETQSECFSDRVVRFNNKNIKKLLGLLKEYGTL